MNGTVSILRRYPYTFLTVTALTALILLLNGLAARAAVPAPRLAPEFVEVLRNGNATQLRQALANGAPVNGRDAFDNTPLILSAIYGNAATVRVLLDRGAEIDATNRAGATALMRAAGNHDKVRLLLERGAAVEARSGWGNTALILAARPANSHRTVALLLDKGANARATNIFGSTALMAAAAAGDKKSARLLLAAGAEVNASPTADEAGFVLGGGRTPLMWAAFRGDLEMLELLLNAGATANQPTGLGTPLGHAAWAQQTAAAKLLLERGAQVDQPGPLDGYTALHWAASTESQDPSLLNLLLARGANPNQPGGEDVDAFLGTPQTPLMLARRRGESPLVALLQKAGATNTSHDRVSVKQPPARSLPERLEVSLVKEAIARAMGPLETTAVRSKEAYVRHPSKQDCTSCHQQYLPLAAMGWARKQQVTVDRAVERKVIEMVMAGELKDAEIDWQVLFHPDASYTKGYEVLAAAAQDLPANASIDGWVHHLASIQGPDGRWYNNLPRPPMQTDDVAATALAIQALQHYPLPGRRAEFRDQVERARHWLGKVKPSHQEGRSFQLLGLGWAGETPRQLRPLARQLIAEQRPDGGWAQLPGQRSDAYATGQALFALLTAAKLEESHPAVQRALRFLLTTQLEDGTWHVQRRAFPFQPTMNSGFPHGRDSWISAAGTSWAVLALGAVPNTNVSGLSAAANPLPARPPQSALYGAAE